MDHENSSHRPRYLFVTGRLAEFALRRLLDELASRAGFTAEVAVLPISVAALMTPKWVARHLDVPEGIDRVILPGHCRGDLAAIVEKARGSPVEQGPDDLRDLPRYLGHEGRLNAGYGQYSNRDPGRDQPCSPSEARRTLQCCASSSFPRERTSSIWAATRERRGRRLATPWPRFVPGASGLHRQLRP